ncbi:hypothetical protein NGRA_3299, partial [Nosema granulosis]
MCLSHKANGDRMPERDIINIIVRNLTIGENNMLKIVQAMSLNEIKKALIKFEQVQSFYQISQEVSSLPRNSLNTTNHTKNKAFCSFHKSREHNTHECNAYANWKNKNKRQDVLAIHTDEKSEDDIKLGNPNKISLTVHLNNTPVNLIVDTGSDFNFISKNVADKIPNTIRTHLKNVSITLANGMTNEITEKITVDTKINESANIQHREFFYIISELPHDGLIGRDFFHKHECTISFRKGKGSLKLNDEETHDPDETILNKIYPPYPWSKEVNQVVSKYKQSNPKLGLIKGHKMQLHLNDNIPVRHKPYPVSLSYMPLLKKEINKLLELKVIQKSTS